MPHPATAFMWFCLIVFGFLGFFWLGVLDSVFKTVATFGNCLFRSYAAPEGGQAELDEDLATLKGESLNG